MASSGVSVATVTRDQIIAAALRLVKKIALGETPDAALVTEVSAILNRVVQGLMVAGVEGQKWRRETWKFELEGAKVEYWMGPDGDVDAPRPRNAFDASLVVTATGVGSPLLRMTPEEYHFIPNKELEGTPKYWCFLPSIPQAQFSVWPVPAVSATPDPPEDPASDYMVHLDVERLLFDFTAAGDTPDFPVEWNEPLVYALAAELGPGAGVPLARQQTLDAKATALLKALVQTA